MSISEIIKDTNKNVVGEENSRTAISLIVGTVFVKNLSYSSVAFALGDSSIGKDYVCRNILKLFDSCLTIIKMTAPSPKSLLYKFSKKEIKNFDKVIIYLEDPSQSLLSEDIMKGLLFTERGERFISGTVDNQKYKELSFVGSPTFIITSATKSLPHEIHNRGDIIAFDKSSKQTKRILNFKRSFNPNSSKLINDLKNLKSVVVNIPYEDLLSNYFDISSLRTRRDFPRFKSYIMGSTALHQFERKSVNGVFQANEEDYNLVKNLFNAQTFKSGKLRGLSNISLNVLSIIQELCNTKKESYDSNKSTFVFKEKKEIDENLIRQTGFYCKELWNFKPLYSERTLKNHIQKLLSCGILMAKGSFTVGSFAPADFFILNEGSLNDKTFILPSWEILTKTGAKK